MGAICLVGELAREAEVEQVVERQATVCKDA